MLSTYLAHLRLFNRNLRFFMCAAALFGGGFAFLAVLLNLRLEAAGFSKAAIGDIQGASSLGMMLGAIPAAQLFDRVNTRKLLIASVALSALALVLIGTVIEPFVLSVVSAVLGASLAVHIVVSGPYIMNQSSERERLHAFGIFSAVEVGAGIGGSYLAGLLPALFRGSADPATRLGRGLILGGALVGLAAVPLLFLSSEDEAPLRKRMRDYLNPEPWFRYGRILTPDIVTGFGAGITMPFLNLFVAERFALTSRGIGFTLAATNACMVIGLLLGPPLAKRFEAIRAVTVLQFLSVPFMVILAFTYDFRLAFTMIILRAALMNMGHPMAKAYQLGMIGPEERSNLNALAMIAWNGTVMLGTVVGGRLIGSSGFTTSILTTAGIYLVSTSLYLSLWFGPWKLRSAVARAAS